jgi:glyoxylase I family protein
LIRDFRSAREQGESLGAAIEDSAEESANWQKWLDGCGVNHSGIVESPFGRHLNAKDPDEIAIEFFVPAQ